MPLTPVEVHAGPHVLCLATYPCSRLHRSATYLSFRFHRPIFYQSPSLAMNSCDPEAPRSAIQSRHIHSVTNLTTSSPPLTKTPTSSFGLHSATQSSLRQRGNQWLHCTVRCALDNDIMPYRSSTHSRPGRGAMRSWGGNSHPSHWVSHLHWRQRHRPSVSKLLPLSMVLPGLHTKEQNTTGPEKTTLETETLLQTTPASSVSTSASPGPPAWGSSHPLSPASAQLVFFQ